MRYLRPEDAQRRLSRIVQELAPDEELALIQNRRIVARLVASIGEEPGSVPPRPRKTPAEMDLALDEFLARPVRYLGQLDPVDIPAEWVRAAWGRDEFREEILYQFCRSVSKIGTLDGASGQLELLSGALPMDEVVRPNYSSASPRMTPGTCKNPSSTCSTVVSPSTRRSCRSTSSMASPRPISP